ncbi:hypothetical protein Rvan_2057 [Rhodomicrobium vannielii ATCC 17100]|uniref:Uncharacterized protein n=1 Tax=Rhodomicrobium vannielii (strain ATCC 17100 / DSM 162 / LMG 4299 / NCIMB 10020 / ATH 3.1.1) TaxID=648757 RepID=E3I1Y4_RHOVT|nr:hypothetical protein [Rhodomicrobium vannielii]ADP71285.1 hypothetical protein Rvan_2057 [Rhodomicrobium vannielii ATCC 17100]
MAFSLVPAFDLPDTGHSAAEFSEHIDVAAQACSLLLTAIESRAPNEDRWATVECAVAALERAVSDMKSALEKPKEACLPHQGHQSMG